MRQKLRTKHLLKQQQKSLPKPPPSLIKLSKTDELENFWKGFFFLYSLKADSCAHILVPKKYFLKHQPDLEVLSTSDPDVK